MMNTWDLNKTLNVGKKVQSILGSGTQSRKKSHLPSNDPSQTPIQKNLL